MSIHQVVLLEIESLSASQRKLDSASEEMQELRNKLQSMNSMLYLIEVLQTVGPEIDQFCQDVPKLSAEELATKVAQLLIRKGFVEYEHLKSVRPFYDKTMQQCYQGFLKLLGRQLESKDVAMILNPIGSSYCTSSSNISETVC